MAYARPVDESLSAFLRSHPCHHEYEETWPLATPVPLRAALGFAGVLPPAAVRSSILAIVTGPAPQVLFIHPHQPTGDIAHLIPGGRPEPGESPEETVVREVGEETGWRVRPGPIIGYRHFHHLGPLTAEMADRPYPDFVQPIFAATAESYDSALLATGEAPAGMVDIAWARRVTRTHHRPLLDAAERAAANESAVRT